jgi:hypothetical protein
MTKMMVCSGNAHWVFGSSADRGVRSGGPDEDLLVKRAASRGWRSTGIAGSSETCTLDPSDSRPTPKPEPASGGLPALRATRSEDVEPPTRG